MPERRVEAHDRRRRRDGADGAHGVAHLRGAAAVPGRAAGLEEALGAQQRTLAQREEWVQLAGHRRPRRVAGGDRLQLGIKLPLLNPAMDDSAVDAERAGGGAKELALDQEMAVQHALSDSVPAGSQTTRGTRR